MGKSFTAKEKQKIADEIIEFLQERELFHDVSLYVNNKRYSSNKSKSSHAVKTKFGEYYATDNVNVKDCVEYSNPDLITMTFEGPFYEELNYSSDGTTYEAFSELLNKHGMYFEQGYAWSLAVYTE